MLVIVGEDGICVLWIMEIVCVESVGYGWDIEIVEMEEVERGGEVMRGLCGGIRGGSRE